MAIVMGLALALILVGLAMCYTHERVGGVLGRVVYWVGVALIVVGLVLLLTPVLVWLNAALRSMLSS